MARLPVRFSWPEDEDLTSDYLASSCQKSLTALRYTPDLKSTLLVSELAALCGMIILHKASAHRHRVHPQHCPSLVESLQK